MAGTIEWSALPVIAEFYGIDDPETFVRQLVAIRAHASRQAKQG